MPFGQVLLVFFFVFCFLKEKKNNISNIFLGSFSKICTARSECVVVYFKSPIFRSFLLPATLSFISEFQWFASFGHSCPCYLE